MSAKLSPAMIDLLTAMQNGVRVLHMSGIDPYYFRTDTHRNCGKSVEGLVKRGLLSDTYKDWRRHVDLTDAGRNWKPTTHRLLPGES